MKNKGKTQKLSKTEEDKGNMKHYNAVGIPALDPVTEGH